MTLRGIEERYRGSMLGSAWLVLSPLLLLAAYALVFGLILGGRLGPDRGGGPMPYAIWLFAGVVPFQFLSDCINESPSQLRRHRSLVTRMVFPLECLAYVRVLQGLLESIPSILLLLAMTLAVYGGIPWTALLLPLAFLPLALLALASLWTFGTLGILVRDLTPILGKSVILLMFLSAIFYPLDGLPEPWRDLVGFNPVARCVESVRAMLFGGSLGIPWLIGAFAVGFMSCIGGHAWFRATRGAVVDVL